MKVFENNFDWKEDKQIKLVIYETNYKYFCLLIECVNFDHK